MIGPIWRELRIIVVAGALVLAAAYVSGSSWATSMMWSEETLRMTLIVSNA